MQMMFAKGGGLIRGTGKHSLNLLDWVSNEATKSYISPFITEVEYRSLNLMTFVAASRLIHLQTLDEVSLLIWSE
jgi:hypothetical protein